MARAARRDAVLALRDSSAISLRSSLGSSKTLPGLPVAPALLASRNAAAAAEEGVPAWGDGDATVEGDP